jgi:hypothetical protein
MINGLDLPTWRNPPGATGGPRRIARGCGPMRKLRGLHRMSRVESSMSAPGMMKTSRAAFIAATFPAPHLTRLPTTRAGGEPGRQQMTCSTSKALRRTNSLIGTIWSLIIQRLNTCSTSIRASARLPRCPVMHSWWLFHLCSTCMVRRTATSGALPRMLCGAFMQMQVSRSCARQRAPMAVISGTYSISRVDFQSVGITSISVSWGMPRRYSGSHCRPSMDSVCASYAD